MGFFCVEKISNEPFTFEIEFSAALRAFSNFQLEGSFSLKKTTFYPIYFQR